MLAEPYASLHDELRAFIPAERLLTDPLSTLAFGTDASFYRLVPKLVVQVENEAEVRHVLERAREHATPVTFRAAGTSLSGQAVTDSVLVVLGQQWQEVWISADAAEVRMQPGVIGGVANRRLAAHG